jgi:hypothetical protein
MSRRWRNPVTNVEVHVEPLCDCGHREGEHEVPGVWPGGRGHERWCSRCSCVRFNPAHPHPEHEPDV